jgi:hypothetical protein
LNVCRDASTAAGYFHDKFRVCHRVPTIIVPCLPILCCRTSIQALGIEQLPTGSSVHHGNPSDSLAGPCRCEASAGMIAKAAGARCTRSREFHGQEISLKSHKKPLWSAYRVHTAIALLFSYLPAYDLLPSTRLLPPL